MRITILGFAAALTLLSGLSCKEGTGGTGSGGGGGNGVASKSLDVEVGATPVYVDLDTAKVVTQADPWELELVGTDVFTNGGVSGPGASRAFGPLDPSDFDAGAVPSSVPFMTEDFTGGPFVQWFFYDNANHVLYGRYHVYGVRRQGPSGDELYKVQILGFYGEMAGAPVAAIYSLRFAPVTAAGVGTTVELKDVDATAGGSNPPPGSKSACLRLATGAVTLLTPEEALASKDWDLCLRRAEITVNGGDVAIGGVSAVDLMDADIAGETFDEVSKRTAASELPAFDAVDFAALSKPELAYRGDGKRSAFTDRWLTPGSNPLAPRDVAFLVAGSDGETPFLVKFDSFTGATATSIGTAHLRVVAAKGTLP
ncbi:MAG: HmuY family protein [Polyangiaceae bacterium]